MRRRSLKPWATVLQAEAAYIANRRAREGIDNAAPLAGLALSGGGIRSAVFCLGVIQALASAGKLKHFDYLSTVSGGGYIGSALTWWTRGVSVPLGVAAAELPWGVEDPAQTTPDSRKTEPLLLRHLRHHGSYLTSGGGINVWSAVGVVLRGIVLNLIVWLPLTVLLLTRLSVAVCVWLICIAGGAAGLFCLVSLIYSLSTATPRRLGLRWRYGESRWFESWIGFPLVLILACLVIGTLPLVAASFHHQVVQAGGPLAFIAGVAGGIYGHLKLPGRDDKNQGAPGIPLTVVAPAAAFLALYGFLLIAWRVAMGRAWPEWTLCFPAMSVISGFVVNLNYVSLHRYYRDRLMEAFMPDVSRLPPAAADTANVARSANRTPLSQMCRPGRATGPYHLINTNLAINRSADPALRVRGRAAFLLSPRYCGGTAVGGWIETKSFVNDRMTLPTAMAISGAAVNPGGAADGIGPTRSFSVVLLMSLLNIRLGYWLANPVSFRKWPPNHFNPGLRQFFGRTSSECRALIQLSDGGHFENLGVYELLRRRAMLIVAVDADQDRDFGFDDLQNLLSLAQQDFGAFIELDPGGLAPLMPSVTVPYPRRLKCSANGFIHGTIRYEGCADPGHFFYVKAVLLADLRLQLLGYKDADPSFPDDTTLNQFFNQAKFEAYRELGFAIGGRLSRDATFCGLFP